MQDSLEATSEAKFLHRPATGWAKIAIPLTLILLASLLIATNHFLGRRVLLVSSVFAAIWFVIAFVLLSRPPAIPEFHTEKRARDEPIVSRRDVLPVVPLQQRVQLSLTVACGACLLIWLTLGGFGR